MRQMRLISYSAICFADKWEISLHRGVHPMENSEMNAMRIEMQ
jgi:hypothetical protein